MTTFLAAFLVFLLVVLGMALGMIVQGKRLSGSCGGLNRIDGIDACGACGRSRDDPARAKCRRRHSAG